MGCTSSKAFEGEGQRLGSASSKGGGQRLGSASFPGKGQRLDSPLVKAVPVSKLPASRPPVSKPPLSKAPKSKAPKSKPPVSKAKESEAPVLKVPELATAGRELADNDFAVQMLVPIPPEHNSAATIPYARHGNTKTFDDIASQEVRDDIENTFEGHFHDVGPSTSNISPPNDATTLITNSTSKPRPRCEHCNGRHPIEKCWDLHPELRPARKSKAPKKKAPKSNPPTPAAPVWSPPPAPSRRDPSEIAAMAAAAAEERRRRERIQEEEDRALAKRLRQMRTPRENDELLINPSRWY